MNGDFGYKAPGFAWDNNDGNLPVGHVATGPMGEKYTLVQMDTGAGPVACSAGSPLGVYSGSDSKVTADFSDSNETLFVGVATCAATDGQFLWVLSDGFIDSGKNLISGGLTITTDGNVTDRQDLYWSADNQFIGVSESSQNTNDSMCGIAFAADSSTSLTSAYIKGRAKIVPVKTARQ